MGLVFLANRSRRLYAENAVVKNEHSPPLIKRDTGNKKISHSQNVKPLTLSNRMYLYSLPEFAGHIKNE